MLKIPLNTNIKLQNRRQYDKIKNKKQINMQCQHGFQYFSSVPVLHYLQVVLCIKIWTFSWIPCIMHFQIIRYQRPF